MVIMVNMDIMVVIVMIIMVIRVIMIIGTDRTVRTHRDALPPEVYISIFVMQKYSNQGISCKYIQIRVFYAEILVRYRYALPSHARLTIWIGPNQTKLHQNAQLQ